MTMMMKESYTNALGVQLLRNTKLSISIKLLKYNTEASTDSSSNLATSSLSCVSLPFNRM